MLSCQENGVRGLFVKGRRDLKVREVFIVMSTHVNWNRGGKMSGGEIAVIKVWKWKVP